MEMQESTYWLWMAGGALLAFGLFCGVGLRGEMRQGRIGSLSLLLGSVGGLLGAKLAYYLCQITFMIAAGWKETLFRLHPEELSFFGGAAGVCLGVAVAARLAGERPMRMLDLFAPWGLLLGALARFGENFLGQVGIGPYLENPSLCFFPLAKGFSYGEDWTEWYLAVFVLEGLAMLATAAVSFFRFRQHRFLRSLFWLCLPQILLENLRMGSFMWFFCIRVEQLACMVTMFVLLILYGLRAETGWRRFRPAGLALLCAGLFILCEFALEGKIPFLRFLNQEACYGLMALGQAVLGAVEIRAFRRMVRNEEKSERTRK